MMKQIVVAIWAFIFGNVIGYIGGALDALSYSPIIIGIIATVLALLTSNIIPMISNSSSK